MSPTLYAVLSILFVVVAAVLILVILMQRGRGGGLVGAFGGPGGSSAFGAKTGDVFTVITVVTAALFLIIGCLLAFRPAGEPDEGSIQTPTPIESPAPLTEKPGILPIESGDSTESDAPAQPEQN